MKVSQNWIIHQGGAENAGLENAGPMMSETKVQIAILENAGLKMRDRKTRKRKMQDQNFMIKMQDRKMWDWKMQNP